MVEYVKVLITSSVFNAQADHFHKIKTCLISRTRPNKVVHHALVSPCVFFFHFDIVDYYFHREYNDDSCKKTALYRLQTLSNRGITNQKQQISDKGALRNMTLPKCQRIVLRNITFSDICCFWGE